MPNLYQPNPVQTIEEMLEDMKKSLAFKKFQCSNVKDKSFSDWYETVKEKKEYRFLSAYQIKSLFKYYVNSRLDTFAQDFRNIKVKALSIDHTHKVTKKIGVTKKKRFQPAFSALLLAINENNCVASFSFTKSKSITDLKESFLEISKRNNVELVLTDDCCKDRGSLTSIFKSK